MTLEKRTINTVYHLSLSPSLPTFMSLTQVMVSPPWYWLVPKGDFHAAINQLSTYDCGPFHWHRTTLFPPFYFSLSVVPVCVCRKPWLYNARVNIFCFKMLLSLGAGPQASDIHVSLSLWCTTLMHSAWLQTLARYLLNWQRRGVIEIWNRNRKNNIIASMAHTSHVSGLVAAVASTHYTEALTEFRS